MLSFAHFVARLKACVPKGYLVFDNLWDRTHGAAFHAIATCDAGVLVDDRDNAVYYLEYLLRAIVDANAAANTFFL